MPKVMKDMANSILATYAGLVHDLCFVGFYIGGDALQLRTLDFPVGYVARLDGFGPVTFPKVEGQICIALPRVLRLILSGRMLMEVMKLKIENYRETVPIARMGVVSQQIVPTFVPVPLSVRHTKKRKVNE